MDYVNEKTTAIVTVAFKDEDGSAVTPTAAYYRLDCITTGKAIKAETAISGLDTSVDITITATENAIQTASNSEEEKALTVRFTYSAGTKQGVAEYRYKVRNLAYQS